MCQNSYQIAFSFIASEQILPDGSYLGTLHPLGLPSVQVRSIGFRIEPLLAQRLAAFPCSHNSTPAGYVIVGREECPGSRGNHRCSCGSPLVEIR